MIIERCTVEDYKRKQSLTFHCNAYWCTIKSKSTRETFNRDPNNDDWMDTKHQRIVEALWNLENAIREAMD